ncbi:hypothetical protein ASPWEDRAFT_44670 [Aspergillus wentii DTO 134E9]|uniref:Uncharacterized protein n=1 Tax=Aspergillus wentii DTO 134E9 TaxID=1073089 RepID=A0A1L9RC76_ASPWE|nr:uncharacterized protein ASPWEDRAFT_44670 [Aspergillus wentii DTO 134E9]KAI9935079.1 hypothetical protein MW887_000700 [Aspergillus wentii]OJJ32520.1 hypothetical protein ASPWEDRAFT_44670 [Aspergillus wentii DTO 134E9]
MPNFKEWTDVPEEMGATFYWDGPDSLGQIMAKGFKLNSPEPILGSTAKSGSTLFVFKSEGKFYIWNMAEDTVWEITKPTEENQIKEEIQAGRIKTLGLKEVPYSS